MCPQSGDAAAGSPPTGNTDPGPGHTTDAPSPIDQTTRVGVAVTVTDNPGTLAVALCAPHREASTHNQVGTRTSWVPEGLDPIDNEASVKPLAACRASTPADTGAAPGTHTTVPIN